MGKFVISYSTGEYDDYLEHTIPVLAPSSEEFLLELELAWDRYMKEYVIVHEYNMRIDVPFKEYPSRYAVIFGCRLDITHFSYMRICIYNISNRERLEFNAPQIQTLDDWFTSNLNIGGE